MIQESCNILGRGVLISKRWKFIEVEMIESPKHRFDSFLNVSEIQSYADFIQFLAFDKSLYDPVVPMPSPIGNEFDASMLVRSNDSSGFPSLQID